MPRRTLHFTISVLVLLALLLSARLSSPAVHASPLDGKLHIGLQASYPSPVYADINEPIKLAAVVNADTLPGSDHIVIGDWSGGKFSSREASCADGEASCAATDPGGEDGIFVLKAAVVGKHNKILARSNSVIIHRQMYTLTLDMSDPAGTMKDGKQLSGVNTTFTLQAPEGAASSWKTVGIFRSPKTMSGEPTQIGAPCPTSVTAFSCPRTDADEYNFLSDIDSPDTYVAEALDAGGHPVAFSEPQKVTWTAWPLTVTVGGTTIPHSFVEPYAKLALQRHDQAAIEVTTPVGSLQVGGQQFRITIRESSPSIGVRTVAECTTLPCSYTADAPPDNCGECTNKYLISLGDGPVTESETKHGAYTGVAVQWQHEGYQFSDMKLNYTWTRQMQCQPGVKQPGGQVCQWDPKTDVHDVVSGYVCGDPYKDPWTITVDFTTDFNGQPYHTSFDNQYTFDPSTELAASQKELADQLAPAPEHVSEPYINLFLHGTPDSMGIKIPSTAELTMDVPADLANMRQIPVPGSSSKEWVQVTPASPSSTVPVTVKGDCS